MVRNKNIHNDFTIGHLNSILEYLKDNDSNKMSRNHLIVSFNEGIMEDGYFEELIKIITSNGFIDIIETPSLIDFKNPAELTIYKLNKKGFKFLKKGGYETMDIKQELTKEEKKQARKDKVDNWDYYTKMRKYYIGGFILTCSFIYSISLYVFEFDILKYIKEFIS